MEDLPPIRLPIGKIMMLLLILALGIGGLSVVAIALQWTSPQWLYPPSIPDRQILEATLDNFSDLNTRISLATWYASSLLLVSAMLLAGIAVFTPTAQRIPWLGLSLFAIIFSADKATGLHHALIHDFLYRLPFSLALKKAALYCVVGLTFIGLGRLGYSIWYRIGHRVRWFLMGAAICFLGSEIGINGLGHYLFPAMAYSSIDFSGAAPWSLFFPLLLAMVEQLMEQSGSLLLIWGLLLHFQGILQKPRRELREKLSR